MRSVCGARAELDAYLAGGGSATAPNAPLVTRFPVKAEKAKPKEETVAVCLLELRPEGKGPEEGRFALLKRPEKGLLAGLWEFPSVLLEEPAKPAKAKAEDEEDDDIIIVEDEDEGGAGTGAGAGPGPGSDALRLKSMDGLLAAEPLSLDLGASTVLSRKKLGEVTHVFSHVK